LPDALPTDARAGTAESAARRLESLQMLRAVAALLVVLFHTELIFGKRTGVDVFGGLFANANRGVDLFFVLSGFVITLAHRHDWGHPRRLGGYLFNRAGRIYPGVWIMSALAVAMYAAGTRLGVAVGMGGADQSGRLGAWNIIAGTLLLPQPGVALVNVTWTLTCEIFFYGAFGLLILERRLLAALLLWQALILGSALTGVTFETGWARYYLGPMGLEFGIGMAFALLVPRGGMLPALTRAAVPIAGLLLGTVMFIGNVLLESQGSPLTDVIIYGLGGGLIVGSLALLELSGRRWWPRLLVDLGEASYSIYLLHFSVVTLLSGALLRLRVVPMGPAVALLVAAVAVAAGVAFHRCVDQPIQRALRRAGYRAASGTSANTSVSQRESATFSVAGSPATTVSEAVAPVNSSVAR
jgi:exopolysaccharide production protein ExoZ